jgi:hypothetical protein
MNCAEAEVYVSPLNDGERIPTSAAEHIARCELCRETLSDYSRMGAELRLAAATDSGQLPPLRLPQRESRLGFLWRRVAVPRFALAGLIGCAIVAAAAASLVRAQSKQLWFEFGYSLQPGDPFDYLVAKQGFDETPAFFAGPGPEPIAAALRVRVESISNNDVMLRIRAVPARTEATARGLKLLGGPVGGVSLEDAPRVHYKPGESLPIPVEGRGTLYLKGDVLDHQPKLAFGTPLVPADDKMIVRWPVLLDGNEVIGELRGASSQADKSGAVFFSVSEGDFVLALQPFPGAVQGEENWGEITFKLDGRDYRLLAAAPITGGDQPRAVWVRHDSDRRCEQTCLGSLDAVNLSR